MITAAQETENQKSGLTATLEDWAPGQGGAVVETGLDAGFAGGARGRSSPSGSRTPQFWWRHSPSDPLLGPVCPPVPGRDWSSLGPKRGYASRFPTPLASVDTSGGSPAGGWGVDRLPCLGRRRWPFRAPRVSPAPVSTCHPSESLCNKGILKIKVTKTSSGFSWVTFCFHLRTKQG